MVYEKENSTVENPPLEMETLEIACRRILAVPSSPNNER